jgi:hypothetical protein
VPLGASVIDAGCAFTLMTDPRGSEKASSA